MSIELLEKAVADFQKALEGVTEDQWTMQTVCDDWDILGLVQHMVGGALMSEAVINGASREEAVAIFTGLTEGQDPKAALASSAAAHIAAMRQPGALERIVHHPAMDMPATQLLMFRIGDYVLHTWDLCTTLGQPVDLDAECVQFVWDALSPMAPMIGQTGVFGEGPSGTVPETAPLQDRLVDLSGRRLS